MRLMRLDEKSIGKNLALAINTQNGNKILNSGSKLSERIIKRLEEYGLKAVYIEDENTDIELQETLSENVKVRVLNKLNLIYSKIQNEKYFDEFELGKLIRDEIIPEMNSGPISIPVGIMTKGYNIAIHSLNVCLLSIEVAKILGMDMKKIDTIAKAALIHDIGKLFDNEDANHCQAGYEFLKNKINTVTLYSTIRYHHETLDGQGPFKISGENQNEYIKIISLCNYYDKLLNEEGLLPTECFEKIQVLVNTKFDNSVFEAFRKAIFIYPIGLPVKLNNGEEGIIIRQNNNFPLRPFVRTEKNEYNLMEHLSIFIQEILL